jgi:hypothetical protein
MFHSSYSTYHLNLFLRLILYANMYFKVNILLFYVNLCSDYFVDKYLFCNYFLWTGCLRVMCNDDV